MTEAIELKSMPFDSYEIYDEQTGETTFDRTAYSKDLADWMRNYFSNGILVKGSKVISDELKVTHTSGLNLLVNKGEVVLNGRTGWVESDTMLTVDMGGTNDRIDRVVMELNLEDRYIYLKIVKGMEAEEPEAPVLQQTEDVYQIPLAQIRVNAETAVIASVTDERADYISQVTIGIEPPTANSAEAISVSDELNELTGCANVDDALTELHHAATYNEIDLLGEINVDTTLENIYIDGDGVQYSNAVGYTNTEKLNFNVPYEVLKLYKEFFIYMPEMEIEETLDATQFKNSTSNNAYGISRIYAFFEYEANDLGNRIFGNSINTSLPTSEIVTNTSNVNNVETIHFDVCDISYSGNNSVISTSRAVISQQSGRTVKNISAYVASTALSDVNYVYLTYRLEYNDKKNYDSNFTGSVKFKGKFQLYGLKNDKEIKFNVQE